MSHLPESPPMAPSPFPADPADAAADATAADQQLHVRRYLRALGANADEADDLAQETMLRAVQGHGPDHGEMRAFLRGIARNLWLQSCRWWHRRREREVAVAVDELWRQTAADDDGDDLIRRLRDCLTRLQPRTREAMQLHYGEGLGWADVAARIDLQPNGIKTLAQRARKALRECIERGERS